MLGATTTSRVTRRSNFPQQHWLGRLANLTLIKAEGHLVLGISTVKATASPDIRQSGIRFTSSDSMRPITSVLDSLANAALEVCLVMRGRA